MVMPNVTIMINVKYDDRYAFRVAESIKGQENVYIKLEFCMTVFSGLTA
jgi:hypothetical protein